MAQTTQNPFDPTRFAEMFQGGDFTKMFDPARMPGLDPAAMMEAQRKNMEALIAANKAAAAGYQDLYEKQVAIFEEVMQGAQKQLSDMGSASSGKRAEMTQAAFEKAVENMTELAEAARKANAEAFEIVRARVEESVEELRALSGKK